MTGGSTFCHIDDETSLKEGPHMAGGVDLFDFHFRVDVAMIKKVNVHFLHFGDAVLVRYHLDNVV